MAQTIVKKLGGIEINKKIIVGVGLGILLIVLGFFTLEKSTDASNLSGSKEDVKEKQAIEEINKKIVQYGKENNIIINKEETKKGEIVYSFKLEKESKFVLNNRFFSIKKIENRDKREILYLNKENEEKVRIIISYYEKPKLAILIDDVGMNTRLTKYFLDIKKPLSFAVLPYLPRTKETTKILKKNGYEVILHMPMEGSNDRLNEKTKGLIWTDMNKKEIYDGFDGAIESIGETRGFNNHMGSRFTDSQEDMEKLLGYARRKNLYFIDSNTNSKRQGYHIAKKLGIPTFYTSYFIDNSDNKEEIKEAIKIAVEMTKKEKKLLVIGHYRENTGDAIKEMLDYIDNQGIKLVSVKDILD